ncbi:acetyl-CoA synthetase-like protein [Nemania sp. NC0429]|nr:acetyl-CoA synthetase-like protein [Nemania sp. NC0429]
MTFSNQIFHAGEVPHPERACPSHVSSTIYLGNGPDTSSLHHAPLAARPNTTVEGQPIFHVEIKELGSGFEATAKGCTAWALLLASYGETPIINRVKPGNENTPDSAAVSIDWSSQLEDFTREIQSKLQALHLGSLDESKDEFSESNDESEYCQRLLVDILQSQVSKESITLEVEVQKNSISAWQVDHGQDSSNDYLWHILRQFERIIREICSPTSLEKPLVDLKAISFQDLQQVWSWNAHVPESVDDICIHDAFMKRAQQHPDLLAVSAHDGDLTYGELDDLSTRLANVLLKKGVQPSDIILVYIEKSKFVPVAQLAIMKCGCASTVLDASLPFQRQQTIAKLVQPSAILTSPSYEAQATELGQGLAPVVLTNDSSQEWPEADAESLPKVRSSAWLYIVFTSGSTGTPKGAIINHANYASAVATQQKGLDFREFDRVFDFASYAFDAAWCNLIHALSVGGCLCIPSDEERKGDLAGALRKYQVNYAVLTPSVAWFPASELPASLRTIHFGGEALKSALVKELSTCTTVINAYGPAECSTVSTAIVADPSDDDDPTIGTGLGACTWVVKTDGTDLAPVGEIGELWLEGPIIGQGYLGDPEKTATTFVNNPQWLLRGCPNPSGIGGHVGRQGRLYRTGDLVRYQVNGNLEFVGRKDSQVKIRGQRVELGEIEHNLQRALTDDARAQNVQITADIIKPDHSSAPTLVSFIFLAASSGISPEDAQPILEHALDGLADRLAQIAPPYMIPSAFLVVDDVPMTPTGKLDRRRLRENGVAMYWQQLGGPPTPENEEEPHSETEAKIRKIWSNVLNLDLRKVGLESAFTRLGGDSITAMQVISRCRSQNISIKVADILRLQTIRKIAQVSKPVQEKLQLRSMELDDNDEAWPLTPIQQILFDNNPQGINHYTLSYIVKLARHCDNDQLRDALLVITHRHAMLRARFRKRGSTWEQYLAPAGPSSFSLQQHEFVDRVAMQLVVDERQASLDLVNGPVFAIDVFNSTGEPQTLLMSAHHAIMDLVSWRVIWHEMDQYLSGTTTLMPLSLSFKAWCHLQREEGRKFDPATVLPFEITPANFEYWGVSPGDIYFKDSILNVSVVDAKATTLLLGASNDSFHTEVLDILVGTLIYCFAQVFPDRKPPPVFLEGHGREVVAGMNDADLSEIVGWFTSLYPVELGGEPANTVFDMIKFAKDVRQRVPGKGRPYFACRFYSETGRKAFESHNLPELIFNYRGSFQQLEDAKSIFQLETRQERNLHIPGDGPEYQRPSLVDLNLAVQEGQLQIWTRYHKHMRNPEAVARWIDLYATTLNSVAQELADLPARYTLADFPQLAISYDGLDTLFQDQLVAMGVDKQSVQDIYPCTPMQEGIMISANIGAASYHTVSIWQAVSKASSVSAFRLAEAWDKLTRSHPIFSTIFSTNPDTGRFVQIVLEDANPAVIIEAAGSQTAVEYIGQMKGAKALQSQPECFFTICTGPGGEVACRLDMSHALMDALSLPVIVQDLEKAYLGETLSLKTPFSEYVRYIQKTPGSQRLAYWKEYLAGVESCTLPGDVASSYSGTRHNTGYGWLTLPLSATAIVAKICREKELTRSAFLHLAWSLVLSHFTGMRHVSFGYISSGRDFPIDGIEDMVGPLINMLIARVDLEQPLSNVMATINKYHIEHLEHQHMSLAEVQHEISAKQLFNSNITVREARGATGAAKDGMELVEISEEDPHEYDLVLSATLDKDDTEVSIQYRTDILTSGNAHAIQAALQNAIEFLSTVTQADAPAATAYASFANSLFDAYVHHTLGTDESSALAQWRAQFIGIDSTCHFPSLPSASHVPCPGASASCTIENLEWRADFDAGPQILASWALLQASYGDASNVVFGAGPLGTKYGPAGSSLMPTPMRLHVDLGQDITSFIGSVQSTFQTWSRLPRLPLGRLRSLGAESSLAFDFQTVLSIETGSNLRKGQTPSIPGSDMARALAVKLTVTASGLGLAAQFDERAIPAIQVNRLFSQFEAVLRQLCSPKRSLSTLADIDTASVQDIQTIATWNGEQYEAVQGLVHNLFSKTARAMPNSLAVSAWDGELTYRQLDKLSTRLAHRLVRFGVGPEVIVPIYFEKSVWVPVCALAVIKAGGAGVMMDSTQPVERARTIFEQVNARLVLISANNMERSHFFNGLRLQLLVVSRTTLEDLPDPEEELPQEVQPSNLVYISFTSGSTGRPKGAMITHSCFVSCIKHQQEALGFKVGQRVYDFASYAFDASWSNLLHSLTSGSCLCIPSEHQRSNALLESIRDSKATLLNATPSVLRHLDPKELPHIEQVLMGGEAWAEEDFLDWIDNTKLINSYGPGECTIKTCLIRAYRGMVPNTLGAGIGLHTWVVRTDGSERLAPLGSVGELWLEGPQVGRGYIADEEKTAASFVTRPLWTRDSDEPYRFYRTGDLVRYDADGNLIFMSRKDTQVKIRGQRTELNEVELSIKNALLASDFKAQVIADVFKPHGSDNPILVAFLKAEGAEPWYKLAGVDQRLATMVPKYMIPTAYITLKEFPMTATNKVHRKGLRETFAQMTLEQIILQDALRASVHRAPKSAPERVLRDLWADILKINPSTISTDDSFLRIGGDSLGAMRLVSAARKKGLTLSVADIFRQPKLSALAEVISSQEAIVQLSQASVEPFSLLDSAISMDQAKAHAARLTGLEITDIEDVFPCTSLQAGLLAETVQRPGDNVLTEVLVFSGDVDPVRFRTAWQETIRKNSILRTRIIELPGQGLVQVVVRYEQCGIEGNLSAKDMSLGTPLVSYSISDSCFSWSIHHSLYDGWSMPLLFDSLYQNYHSRKADESISFSTFIQYVTSRSKAESDEFWKDQFRDFNAQNFPLLPSSSYKPRCDQHLEFDISDVAPNGDYTVASQIRLAWAILLSTITNSPDASFGGIVSGRQADIPGIESMSGPTIATVPLRVAIDRSKSVKDLLQQVQLQAADMASFEQTGLAQIRRISEDCNLGCEFQSLMAIQPAHDRSAETALFQSAFIGKRADNVNDAQDSDGDEDNMSPFFKNYAICLEFFSKSDSVSVRAHYDSTVVPSTQFRRLMDRFENILRQLSQPEAQARSISSLDTNSLGDVKQIWQWNSAHLEKYDKTIHGLFGEVAARQPNAPAVCSWDGDFSFAELDGLSTRLAHELLQAGLPQTGQRVVPVFFEKSKWTSVCQFAVMKANGTSVTLDAKLPHGRLQTIVDLVQPRIILTSVEQEPRARELASENTRIIVVGEAQMSTLSEPLPENSHLPIVDPETPLYVVFTSGSTGVPKGCIVSHANFATAFKYGRESLLYGPHTRTYDFPSYAFDVAWLSVLYTLCAGGCLCIPSQFEIDNEPKEGLARRRANRSILIPSVERLMRGSALEVVNFGGEMLPHDAIDHWKQQAALLNCYGPSECTPIATNWNIEPDRSRVVIGKGLGAHTWIVEPEHGNSLAAIGDIGELWIEGPIVGHGYINSPEKTAAAFVENPIWLSGGCPGFPGRHGRLYRTGDLARYEEDGSLEFIGRKDAQIKIRGQRVELQEIEHHVINAIGETVASEVVVDLITPADSTTPVLIAFVRLSQSDDLVPKGDDYKYARELGSTIKRVLSATIPRYMVPNGCMVLDNFPRTASGKVDRGKLREAALAMRKEDLLQLDTIGKQAPETDDERKLHDLIAHVLDWEGEPFGMDNSFIQLGGDSISAMRLASAARDQGLSLTVADILVKDRIADFIVRGEAGDIVRHETSLERFGLLGLAEPSVDIQEVLSQMQPGHGNLVDILPVTDQQSAYLQDNMLTPRRSWFYEYLDFDQSIDLDRLIQSLDRLVEKCDIYRTAFALLGDKFLQAVFDAWVPNVDTIDNVDNLEEALDELVKMEVTSPVVLGAPFIKFSVIRSRDGISRLVFSQSHAMYDAISVGQTLKVLSKVYTGLETPADEAASFRSFVYNTQLRKTNSFPYWRNLLEGSSMTVVPYTTGDTAGDGTPIVLERSIPTPTAPTGVTQASLFTLACASALGSLSSSTDVVFGRVVSGRSAVPTSLQDVVGPCLNRLPVRVNFTSDKSKSELLASLQKQSIESIAHETVGLLDIVNHCTDWAEDTQDWNIWTQYQNVDEQPTLDLPSAIGSLRSKEMWNIHVAPNFLEVFAIPSSDKETLTVRVIAGPGYAADVPSQLLEGVCAELAGNA